MKKGICWYPGCENKYVHRIYVKLTTRLENTGAIEFRGCRDHFKEAFESEIKPFMDSVLIETETHCRVES